jgi:hypothetical protein
LIKSLPCAIAGCRSRFTIPAHTPGFGGARGMRQKRSDFETIPLCQMHHDEQHDKGWKDFLAKYDLDLIGLLTALNAKPKVYQNPDRLNRYWMDYQGESYILTPIEEGVKKATAFAQSLRREWLIENVFRRKAA